MEQRIKENALWRIWVDSKNRVISFHEKEGSRLMEFQNHDLFLSCVDDYCNRLYRYQ